MSEWQDSMVTRRSDRYFRDLTACMLGFFAGLLAVAWMVGPLSTACRLP